MYLVRLLPTTQLRDDVERFVSSFGAVPRVLQLIAQLRWAHGWFASGQAGLIHW